MHERARAIESFVGRLRHVRDEAGRPSFREMARRSGAISHATLHDALQGARMPSWETTVEFARACDADPQELRADWERADAAVRGGTTDMTDAGDDRAPDPPDPPDPLGREAAHSHRRLLAMGAGAAVVAIAAVLAVLGLRDPPPDTGTATEGPSATVPVTEVTGLASPTDVPGTTTGTHGCPVNAEGAPGSEVLVEGDASTFVRDVRIPDCSTQPRGRSVIKTWELRNTGTVEWTGRYLHRIAQEEPSPCRAPERVPIPDTDPGETVQVSVTVATPDRPATCFARWMQTDDEGAFTFPRQRPYYYTFTVR